MELLFTEFQKGRKKFEKMFFNGVIDPDGFTQSFSKDMVEEILSTGDCKLLNDLDDIGENFRKSWLTRQTGHKSNDFSSLQIQSSINLQKLYSDIIASQKNGSNQPDAKVMVPIDAIMDAKLSQGILSYDKKIKKVAKELIKLVSENKEMKKMVEAKLKEMKQTNDIGECKKYLDETVAGLGDDVKFVSKESKRIDDKAREVAKILGATGGLTAAYTPIAADVGAFVIIYGGLFASLAAPTISAMDAIIVTSMIAGVGFGIGTVGVGFGFAAIVLLAALALWCANELGITKRLATIEVKRYVTKVKSKLRDVIKYTNDAARFVNNYLKNKLKDWSLPTEITADIKKIVTDFVTKQKALWSPYTTDAGRGYFEELKDKDRPNKHWSGILKVRDDKQRTEMGAAKLAFARVWGKMVAAV